jgi:hypothetical protein
VRGSSAGRLLAESTDLGQRGLDFIEPRAQLREEALARIRGRGDGARRAGEEPYAQTLLEAASTLSSSRSIVEPCS